MKILITGGAGYIGSHTLIEILNNNHNVIVLDNFSNSSEQSLKRVMEITNKEFVYESLNILDFENLDKVFSFYKPELVLHFAGLKAVGESVENPLSYYENNVYGSIQLLKVMRSHNCNKIVFSSSATVYGDPCYLPLDENHMLSPTNPYGHSKLMVENILKDWAKSGRKACVLRYFNPVGAHESGLIGEDPQGLPNNLMPFISQVAIGKIKQLEIYGDDYETRDGTGERDYIHITDLAKAHMSAVDHISKLKDFEVLNIGTGRGTTVKEMIDIFKKYTNEDIPYNVVGRRSGDVAISVATPKLANKLLNWKSQLDVEKAVSSSWNWQRKNPKGFN